VTVDKRVGGWLADRDHWSGSQVFARIRSGANVLGVPARLTVVRWADCASRRIVGRAVAVSPLDDLL
jgi:hypothetical protein